MLISSVLALSAALVAAPLPAGPQEAQARTAAVPAAPAAEPTGAGAGAAAPAAVSVKPRDLITSADGRRIGRVDTVRGSNAMVIMSNRFVAIPVASLSGEGGKLTTSLTLAEATRTR